MSQRLLHLGAFYFCTLQEVDYKVVKIIRNPFYDDHFDLKDERHQMGKTLYYLAKHCPNLQPELSRSVQLIGLGLYEKFELANQLLDGWLKDKSCEIVVFKDAVSRIFKLYVLLTFGHFV